jgi:hypothetical protein
MVTDRIHQGKPKYPADYFEVCPDCGTEVLLGYGGPTNMNNHKGKKSCLDAQEAKKRQLGVKKQANLMSSFFGHQEPLHSTATRPTLLDTHLPSPAPPYQHNVEIIGAYSGLIQSNM